MKTRIISLSMLIFLALYLFGCCTQRTVRQTYTIYEPIYKSAEEVRSDVENTSPQELENPGKIYVYGNYLFIGESGKGVHIVDNSNPSSPQFVSFVKIPGNGDIAVRNNIMYCDSYIDLVAIDISNPLDIKVVKRLEEIFPNPLDQNGRFTNTDKGIIVGYKERDTVITYTYSDCNDANPVSGGIRELDGGYAAPAGEGGGGKSNSYPNGQTGIGGSMARFTIYSTYLYVIDRQTMHTFDIKTPPDPKPWNKIDIGWDIETIFPYKDKLFIGSTTGMYIYDNSQPWNPVQLSRFAHVRGCDPVVANDKYAYVTLRSGTRCRNDRNQLDILDITDLENPRLIKSYPMHGPAGTGVDGTTLILCDGKAGLKVFDVKEPENIQLLDWKSDLHTYDVIPLGKIAIVVGDDGLYQYDYSDPNNLKKLSVLRVKK